MEHHCQYCGSVKKKRSYWRWVINNDKEMEKVSRKGKTMLLDYIMYILYQKAPNPKL